MMAAADCLSASTDYAPPTPTDGHDFKHQAPLVLLQTALDMRQP